MLGDPELDEALQGNVSQKQSHLPWPPGRAHFGAAQDTVGLLGCKSTLLIHIELFLQKYPKIFLPTAAVNPFSTQPVFVLGFDSMDFALGLAEFHEFHTDPHLQAVQVPLDPPLLSSV